MSKTMTINGINFDVKGDGSVSYYKARNLWDCYDRPSHVKELIWCEWFRTLSEMGFTGISVRSYNCMMFTIKAFKEDAYVEIYPTHNDWYWLK